MPDKKKSQTVKISKKANPIEVEDVYKGMTLHQHILAAPDTYIGTSLVDEVRMFIFDEDSNKIVEDVINYVAGFFKIFDEILVNARDHTVRDKTCKHIVIKIDKQSGEISVWNDGKGIPVAIHKKYNIYIPEMIFGNLLTSQNYEMKGKTVGGKNGYGAKLTNIYSKRFEIHTIGHNKIDDDRAKKIGYKQIFRNNMFDVDKADINSKINQSSNTFTEITYLPDYERFGMTGMTNDMYNLLLKRCYDIAACTAKTVKITVNDTEIKCRDFKEYIKLYYSDDPKDKPKITYEKVNSRWEIGIGFNKNIGDRYISFVNGISTFQGGTHVAHVVNNVIAKVSALIKKKKEYKDLKILPATIKQYLTFFINCVVEDPGFNSQTKEYMNSKMSDWCTCGKNCQDVKCDISDAFIEKLCANGLMTEVVKMSEFKEMRDLVKTDGKKVGSLRSIEKLLDADWAGKRNSHKTSLFLTEGDSAKAFAVSGISIIGNERYGVFPLRGKLLNVRNATAKQIKANKEFINIKLILGLKQGMKYKDVSKLRYGALIVLTDQDPDGSHIKGLLFNLFEYFWPDLLQINGFMKAYNTPLVKTWKRSDKKKANLKLFYSLSEYKKWIDEKLKGDTSAWEHKYYKGLGTSTDKEAKESFHNFDDNLVTFYWENVQKDGDDNTINETQQKQIAKLKADLKKKSANPSREQGQDTVKEENDADSEIEQESDQDSGVDNNNGSEPEPDDESMYDYMKSKSHLSIAKAFDENQVTLRKIWLQKFRRDNLIEYKPGVKVSYSDFIDKDLIFFSNMDNDRSIPCMTDGLKPSQRMIMFSCFKRGRKAKELKVAQLSGYVSENTDYHHGETSLQGAIIGIAQNYPGSNNISLLRPNGNFGYRRQGGKDHADARYIYTEMDPCTSSIYREEDEEILCYNYDDEKKVEPKTYAPIVPMILINGAQGIGTGFSTNIPPHNPKDCVANLKRLIDDQDTLEMLPWYNGFKGTIEKNPKSDCKYIIRGKYNVDGNKVHIEDIPIINGWIEPYETKMEAKVSISKDDNNKLEHIKKNPGNNIINMVLTFKGQELQKMFKEGTLDKYLLMVQNMSVTNLHLFNADEKMVKYDSIQDIMQDFYTFRLEMYVKRKEFYLKKLENDLNISKYKVMFIKEFLAKTLLIAGKKVVDVIKQLEDKKYPRLARDHRVNDSDKSYRYLTDMSLLTLTVDKIQELENSMEECKMIYDKYLNTPIKKIWLKELDDFLIAYDKWCEWWADENVSQDITNDKKKGKNKKKSGNDMEIDGKKSRVSKTKTKNADLDVEARSKKIIKKLVKRANTKTDKQVVKKVIKKKND
jgi:DNA topoisomerase II